MYGCQRKKNEENYSQNSDKSHTSLVILGRLDLGHLMLK